MLLLLPPTVQNFKFNKRKYSKYKEFDANYKDCSWLLFAISCIQNDGRGEKEAPEQIKVGAVQRVEFSQHLTTKQNIQHLQVNEGATHGLKCGKSKNLNRHTVNDVPARSDSKLIQTNKHTHTQAKHIAVRVRQILENDAQLWRRTLNEIIFS